MLYITGEKETLKGLKTKEGHTGSLSQYEIQFAINNPHICMKFPQFRQTLPPFVPVYLSETENGTQNFDVVDQVMGFSLDERKKLRQVQESGVGDVVTQTALADIMQEFQEYAASIKEGLYSAREVLKTPIILTPWSSVNAVMTKQSLFDVFGESFLQGANVLQKSSRFRALDMLYEKMYARSVLADQLQNLPKNRTKEVKAMQEEIIKKIRGLEKEIKQLLPKKIKTKADRYLHSLFTGNQIKKMRRPIVNVRTAGRVKTFTLNLDMMNKTGLGRLRTIIQELKFLGEGVNQSAMFLNYGVVGYDTVQAMRNNGNVPKVFLTGVLSVAATTEIVAAAGGTGALGAMVVGTLAGDMALGTTLLVCCPWIGWAVVLVGVAASAYVSYKATETFETVWDLAEDKDHKVKTNAKNAIGWLYEQFQSAWRTGAGWLSGYYGHSKK